VPKSRIRKKPDRTPPPPVNKANLPSAPWVAPTMMGLFAVGLIWVVIYYISQGSLPIDAFGNYNLLVGFAFITGGFVMATQWK
jgi:hypothetical protein